MVDYKKYIKLLKNNTCGNCIFFKYKNSKIFNNYLDKGFTSCLSSVACYCETELKMTERQIIKYIFKDINLCSTDFVASRIIDFIEKTKLDKKTKLEIE